MSSWLTPAQQRTWLSYMQVYHRLEYEMNRQLLAECAMSLGDYTVMNALSSTDGHRMQLTSLATMIGWERSRLSHHLQRMTKPQSTSPGCDGCSSPISTAARRSNSPTS
jgi:hypothetical protein